MSSQARRYRICLLCGRTFEDGRQRWEHEEQHSPPPEATPAPGCKHRALRVEVAFREAAIVEEGTESYAPQWNRRSVPKVLMKIIEEENSGSIHRPGPYYPRSRASADELDYLFHHPQKPTAKRG